MSHHSPPDDRRIRVLVESLDVGGAESHLAQVLPMLKDRGWSIEVLTLSPRRGVLEPVFDRAGVSVSPLSRKRHITGFPPRAAALVSVLVNLYREFRRDPTAITWFVLPKAYLLGTAMAILARLPATMVMSRRSLNLYQRRYPGSRWLERACHRRMSLILANSLAVARELRDVEGVPSAKLRVVYSGIGIDRFESAAPCSETRDSLGVPSNAFVMLVVANLIPYKGHADLLRALHLASARLPSEWRLLCAGSGDRYADTLVDLSNELGLGERVRWLGSRADVPSLLAASDLGLLPSHQEGFSNALLEGMAMGVPMIATDVGGNAEAICHDRTGYIVASRSPDQLADAITDLANDAARRRRFGESGRERVVNRFSLAACVASYDRLFSALACAETLPLPADLGLPDIGVKPCVE